MLLLATPAELGAYLDPDLGADAPVPDMATVRLRKASALVLDATAGARYHTDADGYATDTRTREAMRDATLEHASALVLAEIDPRKGAESIRPAVASKSLLGVSVSYTTSAAATAAAEALAAGRQLTPAAWGILSRAGLITNGVRAGGAPETFPIARRGYDPLTGQLDPI